MLPPKQLLTIAIIIFSTLSFIKLLLVTSSSSGASSSLRSPAWDAGGNGTARSALAAKELALLRSLVAARAPCRLLVFGLSPQLLALARLNSGSGAGAATAFVTDNAEDADAARRVLGSERKSSGSARADSAVAVHRTRYRDAAAEAWQLLRRARGSPACQRPTGAVRKSGCPLALTSLPREVLDARWDVVLVDGPSGAGPEDPGRMGTIYTAAALAHASAAAEGEGAAQLDVAVHDVDRTVERWYAWEYLCEDNLVAAKGRLWHFRVGAGGPPDAFCNTGPVQIL
jgi:uncharacterized protein (TIGR01627 family)